MTNLAITNIEATANNSINNIHALIKNTDILGRSEEQIREIQRSVSSIDALLSTRNIQQQQQQQQQNILELDYADANESYSNNETNQSSFIEVYTDADRDTRRKILEMERTISRLESTIQAINSSASLNSFGAGDRVAFGRNSDIVDDESGQGRQDQQQSSLSRSKQYNSSSSSSQSHPIAATTTTTTSIVNPPILSDQVKKFIQEEMDKMYQKMRQENMVESKPSLSTSSHLKQIDAALSSLQEQVSGFVSSNKKHLETESKSKSSSSSNNHADLKDEVHRLQQKFKSMQDELDNIESGISSKFACNDVQQLDNYNHLQLQINSLKRLITDTASNTPHQSPKSTAANTSETNRSNPFTLPSLSKQIKSLEQDLKQRISSTKLSLETESRSRLRDVRKEVDDLKTKYSSSKLNDIIRGIVEEMQQSLLKQITINQEKTDKFQEKITTNQEFIINERKQIRKLMEASRGEIAVRLVEIRRDAVQIAAEVEARLQNKIEEVQAGRLEGSQETKKQSQKQKKEQQQRDGPPVIAAVEVEKKSKDFSGIIADISKLKEKQQQLSKKLDAKIDAVVIEELMRHIATRDELKKLIAKSLSNAANEATKSHHSTKIYSERLEHMATKIKHVETETERLRRDMSSLSYDALSAKLNSMNHDLEVKFNDLAQDLANSFKDADWDGEDGEEEDRVDGGGGGGDHDHVSSSSSTSSSSSPLPNGHASSPPQSFGGLVGGKKSLGGHKQRKQQTHNQGEDRLTKLIRKRVNQVVSEKASALDRYSNRELQGYYEEVAETMTRRLTRDFDEKLYLVCSDLSACKMAWQLSEKRPLQQCALWLWKSATLKLGSAVPWNVEARNTGTGR